MARNTFYELFANRQDAIRFALELGNARLKQAIKEGAASGERWPRRMGAIIESLLDTVVGDPRLAELCLVHGRGFNDAGAPFDPGLVETLAGVIRPARRSSPKPGPGPRTEELIAYGVLSVIAERLRREEAGPSRVLAGELSELAVLPFRSRRAAGRGGGRSPGPHRETHK